MIVVQVVLLVIAIALPLKSRKSRFRKKEVKQNYRVDTDTSNAHYAINEFGGLEKIDRITWPDKKPEVEN